MSTLAVGIIGLAICFVLMFLRMPIGFAFGIVGFLGIWYVKGSGAALSAVGTIPYATLVKYVWSVMPLFILMGYLALQTKLAEEFYDGVRRWIGQFRGGLASAVILGNTAFGACSGDLISASITFTTISLPQMRKYKYADTLTLGSVAAGSFLALLIPPSLGFIIYGAITETSIGELFMAGIFPGLLLAGLYLATIYILCRRNPALGPAGPKTTFREKMGAGTGMWALIVVFAVIIGGLYFGLFTPTEAGAFGAFTVVVIGLARRKLSWQGFKTAMVDTGLTTGLVFFLLIGVTVFNLFLVTTGVPFAIANFVSGVTQSPVGTLLIIVAIYFALGMVMDAMALILLTVPIFFPVLMGMGVSPITFGVVAVMTMAIGAITPPYGIVVYAMKGVVKDVPLFTIFRGAAPFIVAMLICEFAVVFFPQIALFLPHTMFQ